MVNPFLYMIPNAKVGHIGIRRDEETLQPIDYYYKTPDNLDESLLILIDPMLATGGSASAAMRFLKERGSKKILLATLISSPEGIKKINADHPEVPLFTATVDRGLNENGFILPGLGDAGDRAFGTL
jgi:uracil phosphoribosyltransferase